MTTARTAGSRRKTGKDDFGRFIITGGPCSHCGAAHNHTIKYAPATFQLPGNIDEKDTILKSTENYIGLNCGCYAKFHRQVAHIVTRQAVRESAKRRNEK